jgi:hypothetical protein
VSPGVVIILNDYEYDLEVSRRRSSDIETPSIEHISENLPSPQEAREAAGPPSLLAAAALKTGWTRQPLRLSRNSAIR